MNFEAFLHFQEKHRQFLEDEEARKIITVRVATLSDLPGILQLLPHLWPSNSLSEERLQILLQKDMQTPSNKTWVIARNPETILGTLSMRIVEPLWNATPILHIEELIVHPDFTRQGIGKRLVQFAEGFCREKSCDLLELDCGLLRKESHLFYQRLGFQEVSKVFSKKTTQA